MNLESPVWLLTLPACLLLGLVVQRLSLFRPLRVCFLALLSIILAKPQFESIDQHLDLWVLLDQSESTEELVKNGFPEWKHLLEKNKPSKGDRINFVDFASDVSVQEANSERASYTGNRKLTRTKLALEDVLARRSENRPSRVLLFTDGFSTESLHEISNKLIQQKIPVDYRLVSESLINDYRVSRINLPTQTQVGEPFLLTVSVQGHKDGPIPISLYRNEEKLQDTQINLVNGAGSIEFTTRIQTPGSYAYSAKIDPQGDPHPGNNVAEKWIQVTGGPRILLVSNYDNDPMAAILRKQNYAVELVSDSTTLHIGQLSAAKSVIFNNVPAHEIPNDFLKALNFFITEQGGGFLMIGGKRSFASGGYYQSPIDPLLPITMELKNDHRKLSVAMAIVMDRSGSMAATVSAPGGGTSTKMALANNGAAEAIQLLGSRDQVSLYAVDSAPSTVISLQSISANKAELQRKARKVISAGGGIYVYSGLKKAWADLKTSSLGTKHIILFSDAADSEEPGDYIKLLAEMKKAGATVSVIGLGTKKDPDAAFLQDIAKRGNGRIFFTNSALDIPRLFAQETVTIARSAFLTDPVNTLPTGLWAEISDQPIEWLPRVDAYNLSYARPEASTCLLTKDEYVAPLIVHWRRGMGRTAAITFPLGGDLSDKARAWPDYGNSLQTLINWLNGDRFPPGITVRHQLKGTTLTIDLLYDTSTDGHNWAREFSQFPPRIKLEEESGAVYDLSWKRISPGHFSLTKDLQEGILIKGAIQAGQYALPFGPLMVGANTEWAFDPDRLLELKSLSAHTNGRELTDISKAWIRPEVSIQKSLILPFSILLLCILLIEALVARIGFKFNFSKWIKLETSPAVQKLNSDSTIHKFKRKRSNNPKQKPKLPNVPETQIEDPPKEPAKEKHFSRSERFAKAKKRN